MASDNEIKLVRLDGEHFSTEEKKAMLPHTYLKGRDVDVNLRLGIIGFEVKYTVSEQTNPCHIHLTKGRYIMSLDYIEYESGEGSNYSKLSSSYVVRINTSNRTIIHEFLEALYDEIDEERGANSPLDDINVISEICRHRSIYMSEKPTTKRQSIRHIKSRGLNTIEDVERFVEQARSGRRSIAEAVKETTLPDVLSNEIADYSYGAVRHTEYEDY